MATTPDNRKLDAALADLRATAIASTKAENEILLIILNAKSAIEADAPETPEPKTPEARLTAIRQAVAIAGGDRRLIEIYENSTKSLTEIKAELLLSLIHI